MDTFQFLIQGFAACLDPVVLLLALVGTFLGAVVGVLPGLGPAATLAILLPLLYGRAPLPTIVMLAGIYYGSQFGGAITSITLNVPGEASSVATAFDGYPLAKQGKGGKAMGIAILSSFFGGTIGVIILTVIGRPLASFALKFGPPEYFAIYVFTFVAIVAMSRGNMLKSLAALFLGLLICTIGLDVVTGRTRLTFGSINLMGGVQFLPVAVGLFGLSEILVTIADAEFIEIKKGDPSLKFKIKDVFPNLKEIIFCLPTAIRCMVVGFFVGVLPGAGATIASMMCYNMENRVASDRKNFGKGTLQGVSAPEAANNAAATGAFVPMLSLGIPGSSSTAILLGALIMTGIQPGPGLFSRNPDIVWGLISSMYIGNIMLVIMCIALIPVFLWLLKISQKTLPIIVAILCVIGTFSVQNSNFDVALMLIFALIGLFFKKLNIPPAPMIIPCILGSDLELKFRETMNLFRGDFGLILTRPIALVLFAICIAMIVYPVSKWIKETKKKKAISAG
jgi:putative tricarboxylic transport membrane protein